MGARRYAFLEVFVVTQPDASTPRLAKIAGDTPKAAGVVGSPQFTGCPGVASSGWLDAVNRNRLLPYDPT